MALLDEIRGQRVSNRLFGDILSAIATGEFPPDSTLPTENRLARDYGVSRSVVRSALERLKQDGIVRSLQGSGTVVVGLDPASLARFQAQLSPPEMKDCYACRLAIEPDIAARVAVQQSDPARDYLRAQLDALSGRPARPASADMARSASDADFHVKLAQFSGNAFFSEIMASMRPHMVFSMNIKHKLSAAARARHLALTKQEHAAVITAMLRRDSDAARTLMRRHIANGRDRIFTQFLTVAGG